MKDQAKLTRRCVADATPQPWRNGGGSTRELLLWPSNGEWQLRISVAEIAADGPFSSYQGVQRWFAVLQGAGVVLSFGGGEHELRPAGDTLHFDVGDVPGCRLINGPTRDLNLMLCSGVRGTLQRARAGVLWEEAWGWRAAFTTGPARLQTAGVESVELGAGTLVYPLPPGPCRVDPQDTRQPIFWIGVDLAVDPDSPAPLQFTIHDEAPANDARVVDEGLDAFNAAAAPLQDVRQLSCFARDASGTVVGGAVGRTWGRCCELQQLWVAADARRQGIATRLVRNFEVRARQRGCRVYYLETFSFQAPALYESLGYEVKLALHGMAPGVVKYIMVREEVGDEDGA